MSLERVFSLRDPDSPLIDELDVPPPHTIVVCASFVLGLDDLTEVAFFATLHALQVALAIDGGTFDALYEEDDEALSCWTDSPEELAEALDRAVNCTPGYEGQSIAV